MDRTATDGTAWCMDGTPGADRAAGPVIVLIHGLGLNRDMWQWQIPALTERYRVLRYDLYGHGASPPPPAPPNLALFSEQLRCLLDDADVTGCAVAGFSLGGMIARRFAQDHPAELWALAVLSSAHRRTPKAQQAIEARVELARRDGPAATVEAALERWFTAAFRAANLDRMETIRRWVLANDRDIYPENYRVLAQGVEEIVAPSPPISCPTLVMTGDEDGGNSPQMSRAIAAEITGAETVILPGLRHLALVEAPALCNRKLRSFFDRNLQEAV